jgi:hypothetical protein
MAATNEELRKKLAEQEAHIRNQDKLISGLSKSVEDLQRRSLGHSPSPAPSRAPVDYTEQFSALPPSAVRDMVAAVGDRMVADIVQDQRGRAAPSAEPSKPVTKTSGWQEPRPLSAPPGIALADRLVDQQDALDKAEAVAKLARLAKGGAK